MLLTQKKDRYYAVISEKNGKMLLLDGQLPIFWNKSTAQDVCDKFPGSVVKPIYGDQLQKLLQL